jgi:apolipoprotein N-acyltransferase
MPFWSHPDAESTDARSLKTESAVGRLGVSLLLAASSGLLLVLALPKPDLYALGWIALVPLLMALSVGSSPRFAFLTGYVGGLVFFGGTCYWIVSTMSTYGGLSVPVSIAVFALFVAVFALHTALFGLLMWSHIKRFGAYGLLLAAPTWVAIELIQTHLIFGGFPWMLAGYALAPFGGLRQVVTWTGIYGLSFIVAAMGSLIVFGIRGRDWRFIGASLVVILVASALPGPGGDIPDDPLSVRLVQTNIDLDQSWLPDDLTRLLDELHQLSTVGAGTPDLVVWPETPAPFRLEPEAFFLPRAARIARDLNAHFLVGYIDSIGTMPSNSAALIAPSGEQVSRYDKMHLVPFGEYVPLKNLLFFAESLVRNVGDFAPGSEYTMNRLDGHNVAATICYEDVFPGLIRRFTNNGAEVIVNITNDGWFGETSAPYQHLRMSTVRAAENRRYIVRGANTGMTAIIDPFGNILARTELGERTVLDGVAGYRTDRTFYVRYGDVFAYLVTFGMTLSIVGSAVAWRPRSRQAGQAKT